MSTQYLYSVDLPLSQKKIIYRELFSEDQLNILKAQNMLPFEPEFLEDYARSFKNIIKNCVENKEIFDDLNFIDYILFVAKLRITSIGESLELYFNPEENDVNLSETDKTLEIKKIKTLVSINRFIKNFYNLTKDVFDEKIYSLDKKINIKLDWPKIKFEPYFLLDLKKAQHNLFLNSLCFYIKEVEINETLYKTDDWDYEQLVTFFESLPINVTNQIQKIVSNVCVKIQKNNILNLPKNREISFNLYNGSYQLILRLFFMDNLQNIYEEYYVLAEKNILPQYLDKKTVAERKIFFSLWEEEIKSAKGSKALDILK